MAPFAATTGACVTSIVEADIAGDAFGAGASGDATAILMPVELQVVKGDALERRARFYCVQATFRLRCNVSTIAGQGGRRARAQHVVDALMASIDGATIGSGPAWFDSWKRVGGDGHASTFDFVATAKFVVKGRSMQSLNLPTQPLTRVDVVASINPNAQLPNIQVAQDIATT